MITADSAVTVDVTLLRGLEPVMSPDEQAQLTAMLTSGDTSELAKAARVFYNLGVLLKKGVLVEQRTFEQQQEIQDSFTKEIKPSEKRTKNRPAFNNREERVAAEKKENDVEKRQRGHALPLPVRMPRFVMVSPFDPDGTPQERKKLFGIVGKGGTKTVKPSITFVDDTWDGTLGAAFTKLHVKNPQTDGVKKLIPTRKDSAGDMVHVEKELKPSPGFDEIVHRTPGGYEEPLNGSKTAAVEEPRVLIASVHNDAAKLGLARGDVVTHVNGEEFTGTAHELNLLIQAHYASYASDEEESALELVVNAEPCIAASLKLRAMDVY